MSHLTSAQPTMAIVYDRATVAFGGAEDLLQVLHQAFPTAPLITSLWNPKLAWTKNWLVRPSFLQKIPFAHRLHRLLVPLMPIAFELQSLADYQIILSVSSAEAKGVITKPEQLHVCYLFTPTRYLYEYDTAYSSVSGWHTAPIIKQGVALMRKYLTWWDQSAALRPDHYLTLSQKSATKIHATYHRSARVLYPPVISNTTTSDLSLTQAIKPLRYALSLSRLVAYKRIQAGIEACVSSQLPIIIIGAGPDFHRLARLYPQLTLVRTSQQTTIETLSLAKQTKKTIIFLGTVSDKERNTLIEHAKMLLMLGDEDFGITALQASIMNTPVILSAHSGAAELLATHPQAICLSNIYPTEISRAIGALDKSAKVNSIQFTQLDQVKPEFFIRQIQEIVYDEWRKHMKKYDKTQRRGE